MVEFKNLAYSVGSRILFEEASLSIAQGAKVGIVGDNGCGKTTLFRILLGKETSDEGDVIIPKGLKVVSVDQEIQNTEQLLLDFVLSADKRLMELEAELEKEHNDLEIAEIYEELRAIDAMSAQSRASSILSGLGFTQEDLKKPLGDFSGGWQVRAALAATLFAPSDMLLLDEPTNHLDLETGMWLENYLERLDKTLLIISHERHFLNKICNRIMHINDCQIKLYAGNYDTFEKTRAEQIQALSKSREKQDKTRKHLQSFIDRFRYKATKAKQAQSRIKVLEKMESLPELPKDAQTHFEFQQPTEIDRRLFMIHRGVAGYGDKRVLDNLNFQMDMGDRIAILGVNGAGKSTLSKIISGRMGLLDGEITWGRKLNIAYFSQQQSEELDFNQTPYQALGDIMPDSNESQVRAQLARFGLTKAKGDTVIKELSGGEKTRLLLAIITRNRPHLLILDEPTNHLDIKARDALLDAMIAYEGAMLLITHDFHFIEASCEQLYIIRDGKCEAYEDDIDGYKKLLISERKVDNKEKKNKKADTKAEKEKKRQEKMAFNKVDRELNALTQKRDELEKSLIQAYNEELAVELEKITNKLKSVEEQWMELAQKRGE